MLAVKAQNTAIAQQLINQGALLTAKGLEGKPALSYAKASNLPLVIKSSQSKQTDSKLKTLEIQVKYTKSPYYAWSILTIAVAQKQALLIRE